MWLDSMIFQKMGNHMWEPKGDPDPGGLFAETSFGQIWCFFFLRQEARSSGNAGSNISGSRLPAAATFLVTFGSQEAQYGGCFGFVSEGASFPVWAKRLQFHQGCFVFFTGGSGWQMNEMMQKASAF